MKNASSRFCQACGAGLTENARFCQSCGKEVVLLPRLETQPYVTEEATRPAQSFDNKIEKKKRGRIVLWLLVGFVITTLTLSGWLLAIIVHLRKYL